MCGRFAQSKDVNDLITEFVATGGDFREWQPSWNIAPTQTIPVLIHSAKGEAAPTRRLEPARWSLTPSWSKELKLKYPTFNARSEGIAAKATWKGPLKSHRALIPVDGYFEWQTFADGTKTPHFIRNPSGESLLLAGLYSWWKDRSKADDDPSLWTLTATILTSDAVDELLHIHDRNPVMLPESWWDRWLDPTIEGTQELVDAAVNAALPVASSLEVYEVARIPFKGNGPQLIKPV
ncbi:MAG: SOS response-associated peptidase [Kineosporiaceae bacterium]|nr:SOS response-associated peptidase [Aeromicrobium sp.]